MKQHVLALCVVVGLALAISPVYSADAFNKAEYAARRSRVMEKIGDGAAVVWGAQTTTTSGRDMTSST
jgi:hypothetical protein